MFTLQNILVYLALLLAIGYLVKRFIVPSLVKRSDDQKGPGCGSGDCGCQ